MVFLHRVAQLQIFGALHVQESRAAPHHEDLANLFLQREFVQRFFGPLVTFIGMGQGLWIFLFRENGR